MSDPLKGMGLFLRPPTEREPCAASVAIDLGLRAVAPQPGRPWACRVSAALLRPGGNGLASDVTDIERLTELGRTVLAKLGDAAVCAAVLTVGGRRTWLLYTSGEDAAGVTATVRSTVRLTFAEQVDYVPAVAVENDPAWAGYLSMYPSPHELAGLARERARAAAIESARLATAAAVASLGAAGGGAGPATVAYRATFPTRAARSAFLTRAVASQFRPDADGGPQAADDDHDVTVELHRDGPVDAASIHRVERWLIAEALRVGGTYGGWSVPALADSMRLVA